VPEGKLMTIHSDNPVVDQYNRGVSLFQSGETSAATQCFQEVVSLDPSCSPAWNNLGVAAYQANDTEEAAACFKAAIESDHGNLEPVQNLAELYFAGSLYNEADTLYRYLAQEHPDDPEPLLRRGDCAIAFGEHSIALTHYQEATRRDPEHQQAQQRVTLLSAALAPLPFAISQTPADLPIRVGMGPGMEGLGALFEAQGAEIIPLDDTFRPADHFFHPLDMTLVSTDPMLYAEDMPALCRVLIFEAPPDAVGMNDKDRLKNIDFVLCPTESCKQALVEGHGFAPYQVVVTGIGDDQVRTSPDAARRQLRECLAEMVLFYAHRLECRDSHEQAYWLLEHAARRLPESEEVGKKFMEVQRTILHLSHEDEYQKLYDESADLSYLPTTVAGNKRYEWLLNRMRACGELRSLADVGCHKGEFCVQLSRDGYQMTGVDIAGGNIAVAREQAAGLTDLAEVPQYQQGRLEDLGSLFPPNRFDGVLLMEILEHVPDVEVALRSAETVVKPGGYVFITVPYNILQRVPNVIFNQPREHPEHVRRFLPENIPVYFQGRRDLAWEEIVEDAGFEKRTWFGISYRVE